MRLFDLHCDTISKLLEENKQLYENDLEVSILKAEDCTPWVQCFAFWFEDDCRGNDAIKLFDSSIKKFNEQIKLNEKYIKQCKTKEDIDCVVNNKFNGAIVTIEGSAALAGDLNRLNYFKECGVKAITLTWNGRCEVGDGSLVENPKGITEFGKKVVKEMEKLKIAIDISHASDSLFYDVCENTKEPIIATHSNSRKVCNHRRNLTDEQFEIIKSRGGIVGINYHKDFLSLNSNLGFCNILKHVEHFLSLSGGNVVCLGSDFDGANMPKDILGVESMGKLYNYFLKNNYKEELVDAIFFRNAYNFFSKIN